MQTQSPTTCFGSVDLHQPEVILHAATSMKQQGFISIDAQKTLSVLAGNDKNTVH